MLEKRIPETCEGITGKEKVEKYDELQKRMRDLGLLVTDAILQAGLDYGNALEIGPGPGYLGLEWLKKTAGTKVHWLEISEDMIKVAQKNAKEYKLEDRVNWVISDATRQFPFNDNTFDVVFSSGSLHEWENPVKVLNEIHRVLKSGGKLFISDLKRDITPTIYTIMARDVSVEESSQIGLKRSIEAAYLKNEIIEILSSSNINKFSVLENPFGLTITGMKD